MKTKMRKLLAMSPKEFAFRVGRSLADSWEQYAYRSGRLEWPSHVWRRRLCRHVEAEPEAAELPSWWLQHMRNRVEPAFPLRAAELNDAAALYGSLFHDRLPALRARADRICEGHFSFLGMAVQIPDPIPWHTDPRTGRPWPRTFHSRIDIPFCRGDTNERGHPDVKHVWELNRHEFLIECGKAYFLTKDVRYARRVFEIIDSWIDNNPYLEGVNWAGPLEVAVRSLSWLWAYQFCRGWEDVEPEPHYRVIQALYRHASYLHRHLEYFISPNNHLVGEAAALYLLSSFLPEFDESPAWQRRAWQVLSREPERQFHSDGGSTEQANYYHNYCLGFFLLALLVRRRQGRPVTAPMLERMERAVEFTMWMTRPDGTVPRIGDADDSRSIRFEARRRWDFRNLICLGAVLFGRAEFRAAAGTFSEDALWLLGRGAYEQFQNLPRRFPKPRSRAFGQSGYYIMRSGWGEKDHHLCFDGGPIGVGLFGCDIPSSSHGHADMLSFTLTAYGVPVLVDGGFYTFNGDPVWHRYFRESQAHNTMRVDGCGQARFLPSNAWSCAATPEPVCWLSTDQYELVECAHAGFYGPSGDVRHRRAIFWHRDWNCWIVLDRVEGNGRHLIEIFYHFASGTAEALPAGDGAVCSTDGGVRLSVRRLTGDSMHVEIVQGGQGPDGGWIGTSYGVRQSAPVARFSGEVTLPVSVSFALIPSLTSEGTTPVPPVVRGTDSRGNDDVACRIIRGPEEDCLTYRWSSSSAPGDTEGSLRDRIVLARSAADSPENAMSTVHPDTKTHIV